MSWDTTERNVLRLQSEADAAEQELWTQLERLSTLQAKVARKRKVLEQARKRAQDQTNCLIREMEADGEDLTRTVLDASALEADLFGSLLDPSVADGTAEVSGGSSQGSR